MSKEGFDNGRFKENSVIIDKYCRRFNIENVKYLGPSFNPLLWSWKSRTIRIEYQFGKPDYLTFADARNEVMDLICNRGWYSQGWQNENEFREESMRSNNMEEFILGSSYGKNDSPVGGITFYGKWVY